MWHPDMPEEYKNQIVTGDARELAKRIPDESMDLIFCDPVFPMIDQYKWLGSMAERVLVEGGNLLAQCGNYYISESLNAINESGLDFQEVIAEVYPYGRNQMWRSRSFVKWQPYLWYSKGKRKGAWCYNTYMAKGPDKNYHKWGDGIGFFLEYIERFTVPGDTVLDPFTGGGTVPAACKILGRDYIAFEIDPDTAELARERVLNTQPPLFVMEPEQLEFDSG